MDDSSTDCIELTVKYLLGVFSSEVPELYTVHVGVLSLLLYNCEDH